MSNDNENTSYTADQKLLHDRIEELETKLAYHEDTLQTLDDVIAEQDRLLARQQMQLQLLAEKFKSLEARQDHPQASAGDERPPHY